MSLCLATGLKPLNGNRKTPVEFGGNMAAWRRERFERGGLWGGKLERKLKKSEVNHLDVLAVHHPSVSPADKAMLHFLCWSSASGWAARVFFISSRQLLVLVSILSIRSCHLSFLTHCVWRCWVPQECLSEGVWVSVAQCSSSQASTFLLNVYVCVCGGAVFFSLILCLAEKYVQTHTRTHTCTYCTYQGSSTSARWHNCMCRGLVARLAVWSGCLPEEQDEINSLSSYTSGSRPAANATAWQEPSVCWSSRRRVIVPVTLVFVPAVAHLHCCNQGYDSSFCFKFMLPLFFL